MKKLISLLICVLLIMLQCAGAFADFYVIDPFTDEIISAEDDNGEKNTDIGVTSVSSNCRYDKTQRQYIFSSSGFEMTSNVCSGQFIVGEVNLSANEDSGFSVYLNGDKTAVSGTMYFDEPGSYSVRDVNDDFVMEFTVIADLTGDIYSYEVPSVFRISSVILNDENIPSGSDFIDFEEEGYYEVNLYNKLTDRTEVLEFRIDRTAPELEIIGVEDGEAWQAVSFGETEDGSTVEVYRDNLLIDMAEEYKTAGTYEVIYTDAAGNVSTYSFVIHVFLDVSSWFAVGCIAAMIIAALAYMMHWRKHTRVG